MAAENMLLKYNLDLCSQWIHRNHYKKVALQFPDEFLMDAANVCLVLSKLAGFPVYILGDTTYGSCCVDEVAANHIGADSVIHFGRSCLSSTHTLPVLYILCPSVDCKCVKEAFNVSVEVDCPPNDDPCILLYDTLCTYSIGHAYNYLKSRFSNITISSLVIPMGVSKSLELDPSKLQPLQDFYFSDSAIADSSSTKTNSDKNIKVFNGRKVILQKDTFINDCTFIYVGPPSATLNCLTMKFPSNKFYHLNTNTKSISAMCNEISVLKRSSKLEQIKDAATIGIILGTLGVADYREITKKLKTLIKAAGKNCYAFAMGKLNEAKLANIPNIDVYVYVACPESSIMEREKEVYLYKKLVTPWEVEVALNPLQKWSLNFETDYRQLLEGGELYASSVNASNFNKETGVSLLSNKIQNMSINLTDSEKNSPRPSVDPTYALEWQGLNPTESANVPLGTVLQGKKGIAKQYFNEENNLK